MNLLNKNERIKSIIYILLALLIVCLIIYVFKIALFGPAEDKDYKKLGLDIKDYNIEYCTIYSYGDSAVYKVYKIKDYYSESMNNFKKQLENSKLWDKNKYYEYIMAEFNEICEGERIEIDREDLYYYKRTRSLCYF